MKQNPTNYVPKGDGSYVLVLPGAFETDDNTRGIREFIKLFGYQPLPSGIRSPLDVADTEKTVRRLSGAIDELRSGDSPDNETKIWLVGHSHGAKIAGELAGIRHVGGVVALTAVSFRDSLDHMPGGGYLKVVIGSMCLNPLTYGLHRRLTHAFADLPRISRDTPIIHITAGRDEVTRDVRLGNNGDPNEAYIELAGANHMSVLHDPRAMIFMGCAFNLEPVPLTPRPRRAARTPHRRTLFSPAVRAA